MQIVCWPATVDSTGTTSKTCCSGILKPNLESAVGSRRSVIYRTRLKVAASMLPFDGYDDFEDYLGPRWHCYLGDIIATIPVPLVFAKGQFESGVAARLLNEFATDPYPY